MAYSESVMWGLIRGKRLLELWREMWKSLVVVWISIFRKFGGFALYVDGSAGWF